MSITDELRHIAAKTECANGRCEKLYRGDLDHIADRIDAAHEKAIQHEHESAYDKGYDEGYASADDWCAQHEDAMAEHGWVKLPKDADGEVIHLGDVVMLPDWPLNHHEVINLVYAHDGWAIISRHGSIEASEHTVHVKPKKPTVEDVLRDMRARLDEVTALYVGEAIDSDERDSDEARILAEYAAKLQLKENA